MIGESGSVRKLSREEMAELRDEAFRPRVVRHDPRSLAPIQIDANRPETVRERHDDLGPAPRLGPAVGVVCAAASFYLPLAAIGVVL